MVEQEGYLVFIESFNHIHKYLKKYTDSDDNVSFSDLLYKAKAHPMIHFAYALLTHHIQVSYIQSALANMYMYPLL